MDTNNKQNKFLNEANRKKNKHCSSITYTTGDPLKNIAHFNKCMGTDFNNPSTVEAKARKAAEEAAAKIGTISAPSPDGASSVSLDSGETQGMAASGGESMCEELELNEDKIYVAKYDAEFDLPDHIKIIDKQIIEDELEKLEPEEEFEVGYITPVYFYAELWDKFTLLKCTQLTGYTGVDYIEARANDVANKEARLQIARDTMAMGNANGVHLDRKPNAKQVGDFSANYASTNKTVLQDNGKTLLFYPRVGSTPKVSYYIDLHNGQGYLPLRRDQLERTILQYVASFATELETGKKKDGTLRKRRWDDAQLAAKIRKQLETDAKTIDAVVMDKENSLETRSRISNGANIAKPQVRALYTGQIYYLKTNNTTLGQKLMEATKLTEAKRYVRRYYIRPQNVFCSNKTDVLQALIQFEDQNCSVYTLNNLGDVKDVTKLTNNDIIYYYDDGILYDKNHVKVMDYDLYIKHEEERKKINIDTASDATLAKVYNDRLTGNTDATNESLNEGYFEEHEYLTSNGYKILNGAAYAVEYPFIVANLVDDQLWFYGAYDDENKAKAAANTLECGTVIYAKNTQFVENLNTQDNIVNENEFALDFDDVNAYGEKLVEGKEVDGTCCICGEEINGYGNNAEPYAHGRCCDACNLKFVIPARLSQMEEQEN